MPLPTLRPLFFKPIAAFAVVALMAMSAAQAQGNAPADAPTQSKKKTKHKSLRATYPKSSGGSEESTRERTARLKRECKGASNSGACLGYTR